MDTFFGVPFISFSLCKGLVNWSMLTYPIFMLTYPFFLSCKVWLDMTSFSTLLGMSILPCNSSCFFFLMKFMKMHLCKWSGDMETTCNWWKAQRNYWRSQKFFNWKQGSCCPLCSYSSWRAAAPNQILACRELWVSFCYWQWCCRRGNWAVRTSFNSNYGWMDGWSWCSTAALYWCFRPTFIWVCKEGLHIPTAAPEGMYFHKPVEILSLLHFWTKVSRIVFIMLFLYRT